MVYKLIPRSTKIDTYPYNFDLPVTLPLHMEGSDGKLFSQPYCQKFLKRIFSQLISSNPWTFITERCVSISGNIKV